MSPKTRTQDTDKLIARWERKLERFHLGEPALLCQNELFTRLCPRKLDKCKWYEPFVSDLELSEEIGLLRGALQRLSYRERSIVSLYCGIEDKYSYSFTEIGHIFKVAQTRIHQIYEKAVRKMADYIVNDVVNKNSTNSQSPKSEN